MKIRRLLTVALFAAASYATAFAQEPSQEGRHEHDQHTFQATVAGACTNKDDFSFTKAPLFNGASGAFRIYCDLTGNSTQGRLRFQAVAEEEFSPTSCTLAGGQSGGYLFPLAGFTIVLTLEDNQDQLYLALVKGSECGNPYITPLGIGQSTLTVIGGTGRFQGATGSMSISWTDDILVFSALSPEGFFGTFQGKLEGSITLK